MQAVPQVAADDNNYSEIVYVYIYIINHRSPTQTEKSQPENKRILPETRFTEFPALSVDPRAGISRSASENDVWLFFLTYDIKIIKSHSSFYSLDILCRTTTYFESHSVLFVVPHKRCHF